ncbi:unnamed protein product [Prunus armeniaca]
MPRIDSKRLPLRLKRSCTDMADIVTEQWIQIQRLGQALHITQMADIVTEQWIQIQRLEQALHITQFLLGWTAFHSLDIAFLL